MSPGNIRVGRNDDGGGDRQQGHLHQILTRRNYTLAVTTGGGKGEDELLKMALIFSLRLSGIFEFLHGSSNKL